MKSKCDPSEEWFPRIDEEGVVIGAVTRARAHGDPRCIHPVVHCLVVNARGELLLQLRSRDKDIQPGRWDTSVGGHVAYGETIEQALRRELSEEIGLAQSEIDLRFLYRYLHNSPIETELVHTYCCEHEGPFRRQAAEIDELRFWSPEAIESALGSGELTPNFEEEFRRFRACRGVGQAEGRPLVDRVARSRPRG